MCCLDLELALKHLTLVMSYYRAPQEYGSIISRQLVFISLHPFGKIEENQQDFLKKWKGRIFEIP